MEEVNDIEFMTGRQTYYEFLAGFYKIEINDKMLATLRGLKYDDYAGTAMAPGYALIKKYFDSTPIDPLTDLAVDFARVFLGAGVAEKTQVSAPYESVYTSPERLIMQDARDEVVKIYRANGVDRKKGDDVPEDHIGTELDFMAYLCGKTIDAIKNSDQKEVERLTNVQKNFIDTHLLNWCPKFCEEVTHFAGTDFYRGIAQITIEFIRIDRQMLGE